MNQFPMGHYAFGSEHAHHNIQEYRTCILVNWARRALISALCTVPTAFIIIKATPLFLR